MERISGTWTEASDGGLAAALNGSKERLRFRAYMSLLSLDCAAFCSSFFILDAIRNGGLTSQSLLMASVGTPLFVAAALRNRAYSLEVLSRPIAGIRRTGWALLAALAATLGVLFYAGVTDDFSRLVFGLGGALALVMLWGCRWVFGQALGRRCKWKFSDEVFLLDDGEASPQPMGSTISAKELGIHPDISDPVAFSRLSAVLGRFDRVILVCRPSRRAAWARALKGLDMDVEVMAPELAELGPLDLRRVEHCATLLVGCAPLGLAPRIMKRTMDLAIASTSLLILAPLMLIIAAAIKTDSAGPVFFRQTRIGQGNRLFNMLKFRTMVFDRSDPGGAVSTSRSDQRVTKLGSFLRRSSLDELPQLLNVLVGHMSIVGPRPHALASTAEDQLFWQIDNRYFHRHAVKPGITGLAQVRGYRGSTETRLDLTNRLQADLEYLSGWSIGRDLLIILRTFRVLMHRNAF